MAVYVTRKDTAEARHITIERKRARAVKYQVLSV